MLNGAPNRTGKPSVKTSAVLYSNTSKHWCMYRPRPIGYIIMQQIKQSTIYITQMGGDTNIKGKGKRWVVHGACHQVILLQTSLPSLLLEVSNSDTIHHSYVKNSSAVKTVQTFLKSKIRERERERELSVESKLTRLYSIKTCRFTSGDNSGHLNDV